MGALLLCGLLAIASLSRAEPSASVGSEIQELSIDYWDLPIPPLCPVLGIHLAPSEAGAGRNDNAPSIDRIQPELGDVPGNVVVISWRANRLKWEGSAAEFRKLAEVLPRLHGRLSSTASTMPPAPESTT
jgi:hypothetical protein